MIEYGSRLKAILGVAAQAIGAELALMLVPVTGQALTAKSEEGTVQILEFDLGAEGGCNLTSDVTFLAFLLLMFAYQGKACLGEMVKLLPVQNDQRHGLPFMFLVTTPAVRFAGQALVIVRMEPGVSFHPATDFGVTLQTLETARGCAKCVTGPAFGESIQLLVNPRQRSGRDLGLRACAKA
jgi:hypothetical protein